MSQKFKKFTLHLFIFILSLSIAWWLIKVGYLHTLLENILPFKFIAEFVAGLFYTSFLTTPIAIAMLIVLASDNNPIVIALFGGLGAAFGDLVIIRLFRRNISSDVTLVTQELQLQKLNNLLQRAHLDFLVPLLGALIIASPFPDELGLMLLSASHLKGLNLFALTYLLNTAGILLIVIPLKLIL